MTRRHLLVVLVVAGLLAVGTPALAVGDPLPAPTGEPAGEPTGEEPAAGAAGPVATPTPSPSPGSGPRDAERQALGLLEEAARAARTLAYTGTQYVATWRDGASSSSLLEVTHAPASGVVVSLAPTAGGPPDDQQATLDPAGIDERLLEVLASSYALRVAGRGRCAGRSATVVEAARPGGTVAGRFWLDTDSGLVLRREVFDERGSRVRSSAFLDLDVGPTVATAATPLVVRTGAPTVPGAEAGDRVPQAELDRLRGQGWLLPEALPGGFALFDARVRHHAPGRSVLHLAYSDGLSTLSLFTQQGQLGTGPMAGFSRSDVAGRSVWVRQSSPERVVWSGGGRVWTLVSDAPAGAVREAVAALPHDEPPSDGLRARLGRGLARLGKLLNPFS